MSEIAYIDEARRGARYLLAAALIDHQAVAAVRQAVRAPARGGSTRRDFVRQSDASRCKCLAAYRALKPRADLGLRVAPCRRATLVVVQHPSRPTMSSIASDART